MTSGGHGTVDLRLEAAFEAQRRAWSRAFAVPRVVEAAIRTRVGTTPSEVVLEERSHRLLRFSRSTPATQAEPILFCYALVNRAYILDLEPDKSVVRRYLEQGFDVYMIDWGVPSDGDRALSVEDYVCGFLARSVDFVLRAHRPEGAARLHLLGYCMGGTMATLYGALEPERLKTLTLLATPIDFGGRDSLLNVWTDPRYFDVDALVSVYGNCPAWFLQSCFLFMNPVRNILDKAIAFYEQMDDPGSVTSFFALERWLNDNIPVAGETFREFVTKLYQRNELVRGELRLGGRRVDLGRLECPLLLLTAKSDHLVAPAATEGIRPHVRSSDVTSIDFPAGHVGLVVGARAHEQLWPRATRWALERSTPRRVPAPAARSEASTTLSGGF
jgi:polyhydroxyalkanoate synthase